MIVIRVSFLWVDGMALFPFVLVRQANPPRWLLNHERIHLKQQLEMGLVLFYAWYLFEFLVRWLQHGNRSRAYRSISFEREAYKNDENLNYLQNRKFWAFLAYL
ncbi:MAG: hypothetical protein EAZ70_10290 [Runella slithyformis]|jgi:hypothetical protein|nr:MAG: hypothetical protein EAY79_11105 [Runella slithyformis]TAF93277.1 MAG: hypothetical protein EAZ46_12525 [Runella sp.]TAG23965.1 MAG: hypothetical protein EAZ38_02145 [Cytophagales bacterium]TAG34622.1 MAG: hypothetical protein EAZ32_19510 [Cytophagia bacterium]TAF25318.1 MAG: hypothetical protein EAZ70_10290 [Runella slithyformis]